MVKYKIIATDRIGIKLGNEKMKWYSRLYVSENAKKKQKKIIRKLNTNAGMLNVYLITLASNGVDLFDIISSAHLQQKPVRRNLPMIVGIACGYNEAVELSVQIVQETIESTGGVNVRQYLSEKVK